MNPGPRYRAVASWDAPYGCGPTLDGSDGFHAQTSSIPETPRLMPAPRPLPNCPISEALIHLRVPQEPGFAPETFDAPAIAERLGYVRRGPMLQHEVRVEFGQDESKAVSPPSRRVGTRFHSADDRYVLQLTDEGFTLSRLRPYESWERLRDEARRTWQVYREARAPASIVRVATRFINNLGLPLIENVQLESYLRCAPPLPAELPQLIGGFFQRLVVLDDASGAKTIFTQAWQDPAMEGRIPVILDIDCQLDRVFPADGAAAFAQLETLRTLKNRFFFEAVTERTLELYA